MIDDAPIGAFLDDVASERVTPAGGTVVAVSGAMGAALCEMACIHTIAARSTEDDPDSDEPEIDDFEAIRADLAGQRRRLLALAEQDATLVDELFGGGSSGSPSGSASVSADRLSKRAAGIPLATAEASLAVLEAAAVVGNHGRIGVAADAKAGAYLADAALRASLATVRTNIEALEDTSYAAKLEERGAQIAATAADVRRDVLSEPFDGMDD
ncbi:cyclodeaminase/cyclohydrolase family protein [Halobellus salinisoli]|uniref:cyclodeaminase/cyclohydrolase family protein n=1 Tax=Halobellus salinisoli TaxID=3108500 RepID=UPI00300A5475